MQEPIWITKEVALLIHDMQIELFGGLAGVRDEKLLDSAVFSPQNHFHYDKKSINIFKLATSYAFAISRNHPFIDGNKRTAIVVCLTFLKRNGYNIKAETNKAYSYINGLASGEKNQADFETWLKEISSKN
ncbi:MAG: type II toxin-antitoxin system death-on-curing family toxin [Alphaproteobacteria bacterium]|jgi:death-on-curing protein